MTVYCVFAWDNENKEELLRIYKTRDSALSYCNELNHREFRFWQNSHVIDIEVEE